MNFLFVGIMSSGIFLFTIIYLSYNLSTGRSQIQNNNLILGNIHQFPTSFGKISVRVIGKSTDRPIICLPGINSKLVDEWAIVGDKVSSSGFVMYIINFHSNPNTSPSLVMGGISNADVLTLINEIMEHINAQQIILMGKSWGGGQAMNFAKEYPNKILKLCLIAPASSNPSIITQLGKHSFPIYLAWAKDDSTIWYSNSDTWKQILGSKLTFQATETGGHRILEEYGMSLSQFVNNS